MRALSSSSSASGGKMVTNGWVHTSHTTVEVDIPGTHPLGWYQIDIIWSQRVQASKDPARFSKRISTGYPDVCLCPSIDSGCKGPLNKPKWSPNFHKPRGRIRTWKWQEHIGSPLAQAVVTSRPRYQSFRVPKSEHGGSYDIKNPCILFQPNLTFSPITIIIESIAQWNPVRQRYVHLAPLETSPVGRGEIVTNNLQRSGHVQIWGNLSQAPSFPHQFLVSSSLLKAEISPLLQSSVAACRCAASKPRPHCERCRAHSATLPAPIALAHAPRVLE